MNTPLTRSVVKWTVLAMVATLPLAHVLGGMPMMIGALGGCVLGLGNFLLMVRLVRRLVFSKSGKSKSVAGVMLSGKLVLLMVVAWVAVRVFDLDVVGFLLGFSALVLALFAGGFSAALSEMDEE